MFSHASLAARRVGLVLVAVALCSTLLWAEPPARAAEGPVSHRVNAGGPSITGAPNWSADTGASSSPYVNAIDTGNTTFTTANVIDMTHPSIPPGVPAQLFQSERWDGWGGAEMQWNFPVTAGAHEVRLYFADIYSGTQAVGARVFDVFVEGVLVLDNYDVYADVGGYKAVMKSFSVTADANLDIDFGHVTENPAIKGIEILGSQATSNLLGASPTAVDFGQITVNSTSTKAVQLINRGVAGDPDIVVDATNITGTNAADFGDNFNDAADVVLRPGQSATVQVSFKPVTTGTKSARLNVTHSGANSPVTVALAGSGGVGGVSGLGAWETRAPSGVARQEVSYVHAGGKFYLAGGGTAHEVYEPATNTWKTIAPLPQSIDHIQGVELNGLIYYVGGLLAWPGPDVNTVYVYSPATNSFTQGAPMPAGRERGAGGTAVHNGKIYYVGGLHDGAVVPWVDVYDPAANSWAKLPDMPRARDHFQAAVIKGKLYVTGGRAKDINATITATDAYDFATGSWTTGLAPLPTARGGFAAAVLGDELLVIGGEGGNKTYNTVEAYNTSTNSWRALAPMPTARHGIQGATCDGGVYIAAGGLAQGGGLPTTAHEVFFLNGTTACAGGGPTSTSTTSTTSTSTTLTTSTTSSTTSSTSTTSTVPSAYKLLYSLTSNRASPVDLHAGRVKGKIYVFTTPDGTEISKVEFWLDNSAMTGSPRQTEMFAPYDFAGGSGSTAYAWDSVSVPDGTHTISARITLKNGTTRNVHATFTVDN